MSRSRLFLLDGMALAYRSHFAFINAQLRNAEGLSTGPIYGFATMLERLMDTEKPTHIAVAWDTHAPTFRHEMDTNYKANRPPMPDELRTGIPLIKELLALYQIPNLELDGYEADDIIGTMARRAEKEQVDVFLVTPDKDFMQLVDEHVKLYKPSTSGDGFDIVGRQGVIEYFGVPPENVIDVLALIGDASDNVPGMPGVGKKTAPKLIEEYGSLENLLASAPSMKPSKLKENLINSAEVARLAQRMVTIFTEVPGVPHWSECALAPASKDQLAAFYERMQFRSLKRKYAGEQTVAAAGTNSTGSGSQGDLFGSAPVVEEIPPASGFAVYDAEKQYYTLVSDAVQLAELANALKNAPAFCFDTETTGTDPLTADLVGLAFSFEAGKGYYLPWKGAIPENEIRKAMDAVFSSTAEKVGHNVKYDLQVLMKHGFSVNGPFFDTMIAAFLCDTEAMLSMDELSKRWLQYEPIPISRLIGTGKNQITMDKVDVQQVCIYAAEDADITFQLYGKLKERLIALELERVANTVEFPLIPVLAQMELDGVALDVPMLKAFSKELEAAMQEMEEKIFAQTGARFNLNSPAQLGDILFERLKLSHGRKTATGKYSTSEDVLVQLAATHEVPAMVLEYRSLAKLKSTYVDAFPQMVDAENRIHTTFNQAVAATGRLSSSNPNLQNIPIRTEKGQEVRKAFIAAPGHVLISADYSQIELRIIAELSGDEAMMEAFVSGEDIHALTAKGIFGLKTIDEVTREHRRKAKEVNFGIPYGVSAYGLAQRLGLKNDEGKEIIKAYFTRFPKVKDYINTSVQFARDHGYVTTLTGRRRTIPGIHSRNVNERGFAERTAINTPIQGSAADLIKLAMISVFSALKQAGLKTRMVLQIHDELLFEAPEEEVAQALPIIRKAMETAMPLKVPIVADIGTGKTWLDAH